MRKSPKHAAGCAILAAIMTSCAGEGADGERSSPLRYSVVLTDAGDSKIQAIKVVREVTGLGLADAAHLVDSAPSVVKTDLSGADAEDLISKLESAGVSAEKR